MAYEAMIQQGVMKRKEMLQAIEDCIKEHQYPPTIREIGDMIGLKSTSSVHYHLQKLIDEGRIETDSEYREPRALRIPGYRFVKMEEVE